MLRLCRRPTQPVSFSTLVQLVFLLINTFTWITRSKASLIFRQCTGVFIQPSVQNIHGISTEDCSKYGVEVDTAAVFFADACRRADVLVAHNTKFDLAAMQAAMYLTTPSLEMRLPVYNVDEFESDDVLKFLHMFPESHTVNQ